MYFKGTILRQLSQEYENFDKKPEDITPFELIKWAIAYGQWTIDFNNQGQPGWHGWQEKEPFRNTCAMYFYDDNEAIAAMKKQYANWFEQRAYVLAAFSALTTLKAQASRQAEESEEDNEGEEWKHGD